MKTAPSTSGSIPPLLRITSKVYLTADLTGLNISMTHHPLSSHTLSLPLFQAIPVQGRTGQSTQIEGLGHLQRGLWGDPVLQ